MAGKIKSMKEWEKSAADKKLDKAGKHGKEGSAQDMAADKRDMKRYNAKVEKSKKK